MNYHHLSYNIMNLKQILLIPDQHDSLARIAKREGTSISEIVRTTVDEWHTERSD